MTRATARAVTGLTVTTWNSRFLVIGSFRTVLTLCALLSVLIGLLATTTAKSAATPLSAEEVSARPAVVLPPTHQSFDLEMPLREARDAFERAYFEYHLMREQGSMTRVAERTGLERTHLYRKLRSLGIEPRQTKDSARD